MKKDDLKAIFQEHHEGARFIDWSLDIEVCMSAAGYYIGMLEEDGSPHCRLSIEYFRTREEAQEALDSTPMRFTPKFTL